MTPARAHDPHFSERLQSWKQIAAYLNHDVRTVQRWERKAGLPVHRDVPGKGRRGEVYAYQHELARWRRENSIPPLVERTRYRILIWCALAVVIAATLLFFTRG